MGKKTVRQSKKLTRRAKGSKTQSPKTAVPTAEKKYVFPIKIFFDTEEKKPVAPSFPPELRASMPMLDILQKGSIIFCDRGNKLPPMKMHEAIVEANAELVVYHKTKKVKK